MSEHKYIYWPSALVKRCECSEEQLVVVVLKTSANDGLVVTVVEKSRYSGVENPYSTFGTISNGSIDTIEVSEEWSHSKYGIVTFDPPKLKLMQFYSLEPISLVLEDPYNDNGGRIEVPLRQNRKKYESRLRDNVSHINLYYQHLETFYQRNPLYRRKSMLPVSIQDLKTRIRGTAMYRFVRCVAFYLAIMTRVIAGSISQVLNSKVFPIVKVLATAQQIDLRCQQLCYIPVQYLRINRNVILPDSEPRIEGKEGEEALSQDRYHRKRKKSISNLPKELPCETYPDYIRLYNTLWLIINDVSFGATFGAVLFENRNALSQVVSSSMRFLLYEVPLHVTLTLERNPLGIKLNEELSRFLGSSFLLIIEFTYAGWVKQCTSPDTLRQCIVFVSHLSSVIGLTFSLALIVDFLSVMTLHITLFYMISVKLYHVHLYVMRSLFYLFYGKKHNILRRRIDDNRFELDQLLMGTLIFTVLIFLLPTLLSFYLVYTVLRFIDLTLKVTLELFLALLNHFPLFALLLRIKDAKRLPGGIIFRLRGNHFHMSNNPIDFFMMFKPFTNVMKSIQRQVLSISTLKRIANGDVLNVERDELYRVLYYNLPRQPMDSNLLWSKLKVIMEQEVT